MKKIATNKFWLLLLLMGYCLSGCTKNGQTGPQGPQGPTGNANVQYSGTATTTSSSWIFANSVYTAQILDNEITQDIVNTGDVRVFLQENGSWVPLNCTLGNTSLDYSIMLGAIRIVVATTDSSIPPNPGNQTFKIIIISSTMLIAHPNTNWNNYEEVQAVTNVPNKNIQAK